MPINYTKVIFPSSQGIDVLHINGAISCDEMM